MCKILVLGAGSFAGSSLVDFLLKKNFKIIGINRSFSKNIFFLPFKKNKKIKNLALQKININKKSDLNKLLRILKKEKIDYIVDFLGQGMVSQSWDKPEDWIETNILNKIKIIDFIVKNKIKIKKYIRISTPEVYGNELRRLDENSNYNPSTPYALTHSSIDMFLKLYFKEYKFPYVIGRFSNFYGEHQQLYRIIPKTILCILKKEKLSLQGNGLSKRNFIYKEDFCNGIYCLIKKGKINNVYHFSGNELITIKNIVRKICKIKKYNFNKLVKYTKERKSLDGIYKLNIDKAKKELNWKTDYSLERGLQETINYIAKNYNKINKENSVYLHKN